VIVIAMNQTLRREWWRTGWLGLACWRRRSRDLLHHKIERVITEHRFW